MDALVARDRRALNSLASGNRPTVIDVDDEEVLTRGGVTHVVRVGNTVRRTVRPSTGTVHAYLAHLRSAGFDQAPQPLGYD